MKNYLQTSDHSVPTKIKLPNYLKELFDMDVTEMDPIPVASHKSLYHVFLYSLHSKYRSMDWGEREKLVNLFQEQLLYDFNGIRKNNKLLRLINEDDLRESIQSEESENQEQILYYLANYFEINLVIIDNISITWIPPETEVSTNRPSLVLYHADDCVYHLINMYPVTQEPSFPYLVSSKDVPELEQFDGLKNKLLQNNISNRHSIALQCKVKDEDPELLKARKELQKTTVTQLREMMQDQGLEIVNSSGKKKLKAELVQDLLAYVTA